MSEPVGNSPRGEIPNNSHGKRAESTPPEREKVEKVIAGTAVVRKQPWYKRAGRSMIADDAQSMGDYVVQNLLIPAGKNLGYALLEGIGRRMFFGPGVGNMGVRHPSSVLGMGVGQQQSIRTQYENMSGDPRRPMTRDARARHDFSDVILDTREEAVMVVNGLIDRVERYGAASVTDLYDMVGVTGDFAAQKWGWTNLTGADVRTTHGGFLLDLPSPIPLR